jgi:hypothetical protein
MARTPATFKSADVTRAVKAVRAGGLDVVRTEIAPDGTIRLIHHADVVSLGPISDFDRLEAEL